MSYVDATYKAPPDDKPAWAKLQWSEIQALALLRMRQDSTLLSTMRRVRDHYNGDIVVPLTDVAGEPLMPSLAPAVIGDSVDYVAMRAAAHRPAITVPSTDEADPKANERAATARRALYARWHDSALTDVLLRRGYRHWAAYGSACLVVVPDFAMHQARIELRNPLGAYPEYRSPDDVREPLDVAFVYAVSAGRLRQMYPEARNLLGRSRSADEVWDVVEWIDETQTCIGIVGRRWDYDRYRVEDGMNPPGQLLRRWQNRAGMVPVAIPRRATLDRIMGMIEPILGSTELMDRLMALEVAASEKGVFPDMVVIGQNGREPRLISGTWKDGRTGEPNLIADGAATLMATQPGPATQLAIDRLERRARLHTGLIPQAGGETVGALRTGRAVDAIGGLSLDPRVQEAQELIARGLVCVNEAVMATEAGYWPQRKMVSFSGWPTDLGHVTYLPAEVFQAKHNVVTYSFPGTDVSQLSVAIPQLVGAGLMSRRTGMTKHPFIEDAEREEQAIVGERLTEAILLATLQQAQAGALPLVDLVKMAEELGVALPLVQAVMKADEAARARQTAPPEAAEGETLAPGQPAPNQAPGLAMPGTGAETMAAPTTPPNLAPAQDRFGLLMRSLMAGSHFAQRGAHGPQTPVAG